MLSLTNPRALEAIRLLKNERIEVILLITLLRNYLTACAVEGNFMLKSKNSISYCVVVPCISYYVVIPCIVL